MQSVALKNKLMSRLYKPANAIVRALSLLITLEIYSQYL